MAKKKKVIATPTAIGILDISRTGIGYVAVPDWETDILVRPSHFNKAFDGDKVEVAITELRTRRAEGKITRVVERKQKTFIGTIEQGKDRFYFVPGSEKPLPDFFVPENKLNGAQHGDRVVVAFVHWASGSRKPEGEVVSILAGNNPSDLAMKEILVEAGFPLEFPQEALAEANALSDAITPTELKHRRDFRDTLTFTIDPVDAKDFDDAISYRTLENGNLEIGVHIADVSHFVQEGSMLDALAYDRATSVYLPDRVNPMLPERISNELCSLRPHEDKYTFSAVFEITKRGAVKSSWLGRTVIHSNHRFTYEEVQDIIVAGEGLYHTEILQLNQLAQHFRKLRFKNGAINFSSQEVRFVLDEAGKPTGIIVKESFEAHQLIEEFMLLANRAVAEFVGKQKKGNAKVPFPYRIHDQPDEEKLQPFAAFARKFGYSFDVHDEAAVAESFNKLLEAVRGKAEQHVLEQLGIRTMAKAKYTIENIGHYGLGFEHYCHFTSPIRRYPDVLVHRVLQACLDKQIHPDPKMEEKCVHCSERERKAMESERAANKYKQVEYMQQFLGDTFEGVISGVAQFGFFVETIAHKCEGMVSIRDLNLFDEFVLNVEDYALVGRRSKKRFRMGDHVMVQVVAASLEKRQLDFHWVPDPQQPTKAVGRKK